MCEELLAINVHKMAPRMRQRLQERGWDAPTKGLARNLGCKAGRGTQTPRRSAASRQRWECHLTIPLYHRRPSHPFTGRCLRLRRSTHPHRLGWSLVGWTFVGVLALSLCLILFGLTTLVSPASCPLQSWRIRTTQPACQLKKRQPVGLRQRSGTEPHRVT